MAKKKTDETSAPASAQLTEVSGSEASGSEASGSAGALALAERYAARGIAASVRRAVEAGRRVIESSGAAPTLKLKEGQALDVEIVGVTRAPGEREGTFFLVASLALLDPESDWTDVAGLDAAQGPVVSWVVGAVLADSMAAFAVARGWLSAEEASAATGRPVPTARGVGRETRLPGRLACTGSRKNKRSGWSDVALYTFDRYAVA